MRFCIILFVLLALGVSSFAAADSTNNVFDLNTASLNYSDAWRQVEAKRTERLATLKAQYLAALDGLLKKAMSKGDLDEVLAVKAEKDRATTDTAPMPEDLTAMPAAVKTARTAYDQNTARIRAEQEQQLRSLHEKYVQALQAQERKYTSQGNLDEALAIRAEKERVMEHIAEAVPAPAAPPAPVDVFSNAVPTSSVNAASTYIFYKPGTEPSAGQKDIKKMQLVAATPQSRAASMIYTLEVGMILAKDRVQTTRDIGTSWYTKMESGTILHKPRIWITARNKSISAGSKLILEYFSSDIEAGSRQKDCTEIITLPAIAQGKTVLVDGKGIGLYKYENEQNYGSGTSRSRRGRELEGLIVSIFNQDGSVLIQQMTSQTLEKEASAVLPQEKPCPQEPAR